MLALRAVLGEAGHLAVHQQLVAGSFGDVSHLRVHDVLCTRPGRPSLPEICGRLSTKCVLSRSEEHTSELQSLMRISYAVFCLKKKQTNNVLNPILHTDS